jgi:hypothetical protein
MWNQERKFISKFLFFGICSLLLVRGRESISTPEALSVPKDVFRGGALDSPLTCSRPHL